jgi:hypothetical protein
VTADPNGAGGNYLEKANFHNLPCWFDFISTSSW